eukprot:766305-Hanusia_phi.AAC.2
MTGYGAGHSTHAIPSPVVSRVYPSPVLFSVFIQERTLVGPCKFEICRGRVQKRGRMLYVGNEQVGGGSRRIFCAKTARELRAVEP